MNLKFVKVSDVINQDINDIFNILKLSGKSMFENEGLEHWIPTYPKESIRKDVNNKSNHVFIVRNKHTKEAINTFQLDFLNKSFVELNKFATLPSYQGQGIGSKILNYIEDYCSENDIDKIRLDVHDKSFSAINFYKQRDFHVIRTKNTRRFTVLIMEKNLA